MMNNSWMFLLSAGICEVVWAVGLKYTNNFTSLVPTVVTIGAMIASVILLHAALKSIPLSVAYAVWTGIGILGTVICGIALFGEAVSFLKILSIFLIMMGIIGCRLS